jgi:hypothetical protein
VQLLANLDCEARWAGVALPEAVRARISLYATLFAACAPGDDHDLWVPAAIDAGRLGAVPGYAPPRVHVGAPPRGDLAWAEPAAKAANDRSATLAIAEALGVALPGARVVGSLDELDAHVGASPGQAPAHVGGLPGARVVGSLDELDAHVGASPGQAGALRGPWIAKARWTAAGRDRARGDGRPEGELRARVARLLARFGPLVVEPWLDRIDDFGTCGAIGDALRVLPPHRLRTDPRGGFLGVELDGVPADVAAALQTTARAAAARLAATGYRGPFAVDAFRYRDGTATRLHPLCELNARHTFGWIAHALARRTGARRLGFDPAPPGAGILIAPAADRVTAWCA